MPAPANITPSIARLLWGEVQRLYVGRKYRGKSPLCGTKTLRVIDVTLGGDVIVRGHCHASGQSVDQLTFREWLLSAKELGQRISKTQAVP